MLTENYIKKLGLAFLRHHYRFRTRAGLTESETDLSAGDLIADAKISFETDDNHRFEATIEATSRDNRDEVVFRPEARLLVWDALMVGLAAALAGALYAYQIDFLHHEPYGIIPSIFGLVLVTAAVGAVYGYFVQNASRYRYIYAVEQFKRYHADEQWIVLGEDVLEDEGDQKYLDELKRQCVYSGFGLVIAQRNSTCLPLITPARHDVFGGRRRLVNFFAENRVVQSVQDNRIVRRLQRVGGESRFYDRIRSTAARMGSFRTSHWKQAAVIGACLAFLVVLFYRETHRTDTTVLSERRYVDTQRGRLIDLRPEPRDQLIDTSELDYYELDPDNPYLDPAEAPGGNVLVEPNEVPPLPRPEGAIAPVDDYAYLGNDGFEAVDCSRLAAFVDTVYVVMDDRYETLPMAQSRAKFLQERVVEEGGVLWLGCTEFRRSEYAVLLGELYPTRMGAERLARQLQRINVTYFDPTELRVERLVVE